MPASRLMKFGVRPENRDARAEAEIEERKVKRSAR
jgi:hypothetical protein